MSERKYWLMKSEPDVFGIDDMEKAGVEPWDGIRNYAARNYMRDDMELFRLSRLSITPVREEEWNKIMEMAGVKG